nr:hypothetical protein Iba_chr02aCG6190 [Ipomoea batatas]GMC57575.1 hypothetical protein Iba_chr02aCG6990 [Ipomoea batatas]
MQPFEYLMPIFADEEDLIASSDNTLGSGEAHGASKDLDICSLKLIGLHHRFQEMEDNRGSQRRIEEQQGIGNTINDKKVWRFLFTAKCLREGGVMFGQAKYKHETVKNQESGACVLAMFIRI